jgi:hypothetical protein
MFPLYGVNTIKTKLKKGSLEDLFDTRRSRLFLETGISHEKWPPFV